MDVSRVVLSLFEFVLTIVMAVGVVYVNYRLAIRTNPDYNAEDEIKKQNMGVAVLLATTLVAAGLIVRSGVFPIVSMVRLAWDSDGAYLSLGTVTVVAILLIALVFVAAIFTIWLSLRLFGKLTRNIREGQELQKGNAAAGTILAAVILVVALFVADSMSSVTKSLVPQAPLGTTVGTVEIMQ